VSNQNNVFRLRTQHPIIRDDDAGAWRRARTRKGVVVDTPSEEIAARLAGMEANQKASGFDLAAWQREQMALLIERRTAAGFAPDLSDAALYRDDAKRVEIIMASNVKPRPIAWLWEDWLAHGKLHLIAGRPGAQKTTIALDFAAAVTIGGQWPDGTQAASGNVVMWSGEDAVDDTLVPRFLAAGGDPSRMAFIGGVEENRKIRAFDPARDVGDLAAVCADLGQVNLIIVDPVVGVAKTDSHKNAEMRRDLQPLVDLAERTQAAVLGVHHLTKRTEGANPVDRVSGSLAFGAAPRVILFAALDPKGGEPHGALLRAKSNIGPSHGGFAFASETRPLPSDPAVHARRMLWGERIHESAHDVLARFEDKPKKAASKAAVFLREMLKDGPQMAADVIAKAEAAGIAKRTLQWTFTKLGGMSERVGFGKNGALIWQLPKLDA
jgi:putative DNA primase/helicase